MLECLNRRLSRWTRGIADADHRRSPSVERNEDDGSPLRCHVVACGGQAFEPDVLVRHQPCVTDRYPMAVDGGQRAMSRHILEVGRGEPACTLQLGAANDCLGQRVLRVSLHGRRKGENLVLSQSVDVDVGHRRLAFGQRARFVHDHNLDSSGGFDCCCVLEQDSALRTEAGTHHDRGRRRQAQSIRTGDDDNGDGEEDCLTEASAGEQPDDQGQRAADQRHQHQPEGSPIRQLLPGRFRALGLLDEFHNLGQGRVRADLCGTGTQRPVLVDRTANQLGARRLRYRQALSCDH